MKICAIDGSTKITGIAFLDSDNAELIDHFIIDLHNFREKEFKQRTKGLDSSIATEKKEREVIREEITQDRITQMMIEIGKALNNNLPDLVVVEDTWERSGSINNVKTLHNLALIIGGIKFWCATNHADFQMIMPSAWRKLVGIKTGRGVERSELKQASIDYVINKYGFIPQTDDEADATALATATYIKMNEEKDNGNDS